MFCIENSVNRVHSDLILGSITNQTLSISESDVRGSNPVALIVDDDLNAIVLLYSSARGGGSKIDSVVWEKDIKSIFFQGSFGVSHVKVACI